jgi:hypothetical protein
MEGLGDRFAATCSHASHEAPLRGLRPSGFDQARGAVLAVCLALSACSEPTPNPGNLFRECRYEEGGRFYYQTGTEVRTGPIMRECYQITDTDGWERRFCTSGEQAAICRDIPPLPEGAVLRSPEAPPPGYEWDE